jgi:hypothetical protein
MRYEIRRTPTNKYELRQDIFDWQGEDTSRGCGAPPTLGVFDNTEAAAQFALQHAQGAYAWKPFDPQGDIDARRAQLEGNLRA